MSSGFVSHCERNHAALIALLFSSFFSLFFFSFFVLNGCVPPVLELAVTSCMLLRGQDTQELPSLHGGFETSPC